MLRAEECEHMKDGKKESFQIKNESRPKLKLVYKSSKSDVSRIRERLRDFGYTEKKKKNEAKIKSRLKSFKKQFSSARNLQKQTGWRWHFEKPSFDENSLINSIRKGENRRRGGGGGCTKKKVGVE